MAIDENEYTYITHISPIGSGQLVIFFLLGVWGCAPTASPFLPPPVVEAPAPVDRGARTAPSDAVVLFDGRSLAAWRSAGGGPPVWRIVDGALRTRRFRRSIQTRDAFGDAHLHLEWRIPSSVMGRGQHRGNSGVILMGRYEVQILESHEGTTYPEGQAGAIYGQRPPAVNAARPPGSWQSYDIVFRRPRFDADGRVTSPAVLTVFHNGVLIHDHIPLSGPTRRRPRPYNPHPDRLPLMLQSHGSRIEFRTIWIRPLE